MLDAAQRQKLIDAFSNRIKKASSNVSTKVEAEKGDYKVVISSNNVDHLFKDNVVASFKVAELQDTELEAINANPQDAAQDLLGTFIDSFDAESYEKTASKKVEAAHSTQDRGTWDRITQKQLDDQKPSLHPRTDEYYKNVTQKQLPEHGQRPGTYDVVTEGQFRDERTTFYGDQRTTGDWRDEDRNTITENQLEDGVDTYTEVGESDRGDNGVKYDGGYGKQQMQIGEKQLMELLNHHEWTQPLTITEGKEQLGDQDGELSRLTASVAQNIVKEAFEALGKTVIAAGVTPSELKEVLARITSHESKIPALANTISHYAGHSVEVINKKVAKAQHFGKTANTGNDWSPFLVADVLVRQIAKSNYKPEFIAKTLSRIAKIENLEAKITEASESALTATKVAKAADNDFDVIDNVLSGKTASTESKPKVEGSADDDGLYAYAGAVTEVEADPKDRNSFSKAAASYAAQKIASEVGKEIDLKPLSIEVDTDKGLFEIQFKDNNFESANLEARAAKRRELAKEAEAKANSKEASTAETKEAQMGGAGGMPPAGGPEMGNPMAPPGGADMGAPPPGETLSQEPMLDEEGDAGASEPKPPGSVCPVCGSEDVDVDNGEFRCNNCGAEGSISVRVEVSKWPETIQENEGEEEGGFGLDEEEAGLGAEEASMDGLGGEGGGATMPNVPVGASVRLNPRMVEKLASQKIEIGSVCPSCGSNNTDVTKSASSKGSEGICWDCLQEYNYRIVADKTKKGRVYAQYTWNQKSDSNECTGCNRLKEAFVESLENYGVKPNDFYNSPISERIKLIAEMADGGWLNLKEAMGQELPLQKIAASNKWKGYEKFDAFPMASCMERVARRFGENAVSMSGPCQGKPLTDCVCGQLANLGIYSDGLAAKVASAHTSDDPRINSPMKTCMSWLVRDHNYDIEKSASICDGLRASHASAEDLVIEAIAQLSPSPMSPGMAQDPATKPMAMPKQPAPAPAAKPMEAPPMPAAEEPSAMEMAQPSAPMESAPMETKPMGMPMQAKPMPDPMDDPVTDMGEMGGMPEMPGMEGMDDMAPDMDGGVAVEISGPSEDFGGLEGGDGDVVTVIVDKLEELLDVLRGNIGDDMVDTTGDDLDMGDVTEDAVEDGTEELSDDIPGLAEDSEPESEGEEISEESTFEDSSDEVSEEPSEEPSEDFGGEESEDESSDMLKKHTEEASNETEETKEAEAPAEVVEAASEEVEEETEEAEVEASQEVETKEANVDDLLFSMKTGTIKKQDDAINSLFDGLLSQAKVAAKQEDVKKVDYKSGSEGSKVKVTPAQDTDGMGKYQDGKTMGHEEKFDAADPDVPRSNQTLGDEGSEVTVNDKQDLPSVPHGSGTMEGEEHYKPEKGNQVDGNQGAQTTASSKDVVKTAKCDCNCDEPGCDCSDCDSKDCGKPCLANKETDDMKQAKTWTVAQNHKYYGAFMKKAQAGESSVKLTDGLTYEMSLDQNKNIVLIAKELPEAFKANMEKMKAKHNKDNDGEETHEEDTEKEAQNSEIKKESQTVSPKNVNTIEDDPDINQSSGPGKGKVKSDQAHSLAVDEKKPSEGMEEPSVPDAPNSGQLAREHTVDNKLDGPEVPAGGGMHPEYDQNENNAPEKQDELLGKQNDIAAMASVSREEAVKVAGQLLKAQLIDVDELPAKVEELTKASAEILEDYRKLLSRTSETKGMRREASKDAVENVNFLQKSAGKDENENLADKIQQHMRLSKRNQDHERFTSERGNLNLWK